MATLQILTKESNVELVEDGSTIAGLLRSIAKLTATEVLMNVGGLKPYISKAEAYRKYGRGVVDKWIAEGLLTLRQDVVGSSSKMRIDRSEIEALAAAEDLIQFKKTNHGEGSKRRAFKKAE